MSVDWMLCLAAFICVPLVIGFLHYKDHQAFGKVYWPWDKH